MAMTSASAIGMTERTGVLFDVLEDVLHVDHPVRPSLRRRVRMANEDAVRTLRQLASEDETLLAPDNARSICNAIARRYRVKPRFMLPMRDLGEQLALEFASALAPSSTRTRLIDSAVHLEQRRVEAHRRGTVGEHRPNPHVAWMALAQALFAVASVVSGAITTLSGRSSWGLGCAIAAVSFLAFARAALAISADRGITDLPRPRRRRTRLRGPRDRSAEIDLRASTT